VELTTFERMADTLPIGVEILELLSADEMDFRLVYTNEARSRISGFDMKQFEGQNTRTIYAPAYEGAANFPRFLLEAYQSRGKVDMGAQTYVDEKLGARVYEASCTWLEGAYVALYLKEAKEVEALDQQWSIERQMLEHGEKVGKFCTWIVKEQTGETQFTKAYLDIHHFQKEEVTAENATAKCIARIHPDDQDKMRIFRETEHKTLPVSVSYRYLTKNGVYIWLEDTLSQRLPNGRMMGTTQDITSIKKKEIQLEKALHFQEKIMATSPEIIYVYDVWEQRNIFSNKSIFDQLGYSQTELAEMGDQLLLKLTHPDDLEKVITHYQTTVKNLSSGETISLLARYLYKGSGQVLWFESTESIFETDETGQVMKIIGISRNVTREKQAEQDVAETNKELEQFVYSVSHDLRAPTRHINGYANMIYEAERTRLSEKAQERLGRVIQSSERLGEMTDQLLAYSRTRNIEPDKEEVDVHGLVQGLILSFSEVHSDREIQWDLQQLPPCHADHKLLMQVWENLISNALKYSSKKPFSRIIIRAEEEECELIYSVHDNGVGFDNRHTNKLFTVFQRLHRHSEFPGYGIGLASVARSLKLHEGRIWASSTLGEGASFFFSLPKQLPYEQSEKNHTR